LIHRKWTTITLENEEYLLDRKFEAATPLEISTLFEQNDLQSHLFMLVDTDSTCSEEKLIMMGCLFESTVQKSHLNESHNQLCTRGFAFFRSDFKQLNVLCVLFQDFNSAGEAKCSGEEIPFVEGAMPIELDMLSVTDPLIFMSRELKKVLINGLNDISIRTNWESLRNDITSLDDHDIFVTIHSSKRLHLEFLKFIEPVLNLVSPTIQDFLCLLGYLDDVNVWSSTAKDGVDVSAENAEQTHILIVDTKCLQLMGLYIVLDLYSDKNLLLRAELVYYHDTSFNNDVVVLAQKGLIEKFVNLLLHFSFVD